MDFGRVGALIGIVGVCILVLDIILLASFAGTVGAGLLLLGATMLLCDVIFS